MSIITKSLVPLIVIAAIAVGLWMLLNQKTSHEPVESFDAFDMVRIGHVSNSEECDKAIAALLTKEIHYFISSSISYTISVPRNDAKRATDILVADAKSRGYEFRVNPDLGKKPEQADEL